MAKTKDDNVAAVYTSVMDQVVGEVHGGLVAQGVSDVVGGVLAAIRARWEAKLAQRGAVQGRDGLDGDDGAPPPPPPWTVPSESTTSTVSMRRPSLGGGGGSYRREHFLPSAGDADPNAGAGDERRRRFSASGHA
ncbi:hypothetical protein E2562_009130 [Oryza meyeriana var. granulata]|uniref:Uncharacterized protein n=1 Tax=Oryza meyeriana var. granulata TaxID=110450 RepID=A0A6G1D188_9ORYZ|nr:hypothetical protein E2562_009130 [Oryza meyeriana var. granulata]